MDNGITYYINEIDESCCSYAPKGNMQWKEVAINK